MILIPEDGVNQQALLHTGLTAAIGGKDMEKG
jgi:hypothetical protein